MIKKCKVLMRNELVMVVDYDGKKIQLPSDNSSNNELFVKEVKGKFTIVPESEYEKTLKTEKTKMEETELVDETIKVEGRAKQPKEKRS